QGKVLTEFDPVLSTNFFIGAFDTRMFAGGISQDPARVKPIGALITNAMQGNPDTYGGAGQTSLFGRNFGGGVAIDVEILGPDLDDVTNAMNALFNSLGQDPRFGFPSLSGTPANFNLSQLETQLRVTELGRELGLRAADMGTAVRAFFDGAYAGDFQTENEAIDIRLLPRGGRLDQRSSIADIPIATPAGPVVPLSQLVRFEETTAPQEIVRVEELPAIRLAVKLPDGLPVAEGTRTISEEFIAPLREAGLITPGMQVRYEGNAAKLDEVYNALLGDPDTEASRAASTAITALAVALLLATTGLAIFALTRALRSDDTPRLLYGSIGLLAIGLIVAGVLLLFSTSPQLITARFVWALLVTYLLMCALFESFVYPLVVMFSVPLALVGGFAGLRIVHDITQADPLVGTQNLDVLTMLGFVILVGIVVNNAILIVHQALNNLRAGNDSRPMDIHEAVIESVRTRVRPVFMSTMTSVGGMLPLVLFPGAGSELYRGLGSVVVGGLVVSTVFTLMLVPLTLSLVLEMNRGIALALTRKDGRDRRAEAMAL
ncbi:MAG: efflux RND transporter permease subunit, partial [Planctomycetota bacterium]